MFNTLFFKYPKTVTWVQQRAQVMPTGDSNKIMRTYSDKRPENRIRLAEAKARNEQKGTTAFRFVDNRPESIQMRTLQELANRSAQNESFQTHRQLSVEHPARGSNRGIVQGKWVPHLTPGKFFMIGENHEEWDTKREKMKEFLALYGYDGYYPEGGLTINVDDKEVRADSSFLRIESAYLYVDDFTMEMVSNNVEGKDFGILSKELATAYFKGWSDVKKEHDIHIQLTNEKTELYALHEKILAQADAWQQSDFSKAGKSELKKYTREQILGIRTRMEQFRQGMFGNERPGNKLDQVKGNIKDRSIFMLRSFLQYNGPPEIWKVGDQHIRDLWGLPKARTLIEGSEHCAMSDENFTSEFEDWENYKNGDM